VYNQILPQPLIPARIIESTYEYNVSTYYRTMMLFLLLCCSYCKFSYALFTYSLCAVLLDFLTPTTNPRNVLILNWCTLVQKCYSTVICNAATPTSNHLDCCTIITSHFSSLIHMSVTLHNNLFKFSDTYLNFTFLWINILQTFIRILLDHCHT
jgi:hypothetical protein